ncbi:MAG: hypothetical protein AB7N76_32435 [Planctomycetota bacterium]
MRVYEDDGTLHSRLTRLEPEQLAGILGAGLRRDPDPRLQAFQVYALDSDGRRVGRVPVQRRWVAVPWTSDVERRVCDFGDTTGEARTVTDLEAFLAGSSASSPRETPKRLVAGPRRTRDPEAKDEALVALLSRGPEVRAWSFRRLGQEAGMSDTTVRRRFEESTHARLRELVETRDLEEQARERAKMEAIEERRARQKS